MTSFPLLDHLSSPEDLKTFPISQLSELAQEMRSKIISVLAETGGHLSSNLGIIELTLALHYVFSSPKDKFIFDVGHQAYPHKLLTGRNSKQFEKIRHTDGLSGFTDPDESQHDHFFSGHAGNAFSLALGMAKSSDNDDHIIPILGDAAFSCGLTLEALNNLPQELSRFVVILNDNNMSISENVGTMSRNISQWIHHPKLNCFSRKLGQWLARIPHCGNLILKRTKKLSTSFKSLFCPNPLFEGFGLHYVGPIDGHNLKKLISTLEAVRELPFPVIVHVCTVKGKGLEVAQENPSKYHGVKAHFPQEKDEAKTIRKPAPPTYPQIFGEVLCHLGMTQPKLQVVTPAMSLGSCLEEFKAQFPERFTDVGIAEGHAVTFSAGIAKMGAPVICSIYSTFLHRAVDNIFHDVCMQRLPVLFAIDRAGLAYHDGRSHHGIYDLSFLRAMPGIVICQPRNRIVFEQLLRSSFRWMAPAAIRYPNSIAHPLDHISSDTSLYREPGNAEILSQGEDLLILALGHCCQNALAIKHQLLSYNVSATVVDPVFVKPLDKELLSVLLMNHTKMVIIEEHSMSGGLGSEVHDFLVAYGLQHLDVLHFAIPDRFFGHGDPAALLGHVGLSHEKIMRKILIHFHFGSYTQCTSH